MMIEGVANECGRRRHAFVILGRSKERSDAAQTLGSIPLPIRSATVQNGAHAAAPAKANILNRLYPSANVTEWILGSARRFASLRPRMTNAEVVGLRFAPATLSPLGRGGRPAGEAR
ncbi:hypothetical protein X768_16225 [Mesorhizobium sp. LSJC265A00]|nr:hypothetical protein X768_16225 [Mesorhizobium sp. LSJC265A00]ESX94446.1 hypothetical protein X754_11490 [Mesorhizobium sp. LNJC403B00]